MSTSSRPLKAHELVSEIADLVQMPPDLLAKVAVVPVKNLYTWLDGKQQNLLVSSIKSVMSALGILVGAEGAYLSSERVHYWHLNDRGIGNRKGEAYRGLSMISRLLSDCAVTELLLAGTKPPKSGLRYFMLCKHVGSPVRVILRLDIGRWRRHRINPETLRGTMWREDSDEHVCYVQDPVFWSRLVNRDLTVHEFDWIFNHSYDRTTWADVGLMARETGVRPSELMSYMHQIAENRSANRTSAASTSIIPVDNVRYLNIA